MRIRTITRADLDAAWAQIRRAEAAGDVPGDWYLEIGALEQKFATQQRLRLVAAGRQSGKSTVAAYYARQALDAGRTVVISGPEGTRTERRLRPDEVEEIPRA